MFIPRIVLVVVCLVLAAAAGQAAETELRNTPCRLFDSRGIGVGDKITSATIETFGDAGSQQGGEDECGVPDSAIGVVVNLVAFQPNSGGWARLWATGETEPLSTSINAFSGAGNEATGLIVATGAGGKISLNSSISGSHYILDLTGWILRCNAEETFEFAYSETQSSVSVPETGDIDLLKYDFPGASIWVGGAASQPGLYTITGSEISSGRQRLFVTPTPQAATDQGLEVHLLPGGCSHREIALDGFSGLN